MDPAALPAGGIAYFPREGWIEPGRLIGHLISAAVRGGARLVRGDAVSGLGVTAGAVRAVRLASGRQFSCDAVVDCAGPQAAGIARLAGLALPMRNTRGVLIYTSPCAAVSRVVHAPRVHLRPDGAGLLLHSPEAGGAAHMPGAGEASAGQQAAGEVLSAARALYPGIGAATVTGTRVGERPIPGDGLPVLGRVTGLAGFHFAVSHSGATLCLHAGDLVAAEALGEDRDDQLAAFRFERLSGDP
jgi:glycine/D-amino acid oxidase-like deaminating enzyme